MINTHTHLFQTFMKGLGEGLPLYQWIDEITAPSTVAMTPREGYLSALLGGIEALRSGTTTVLDFMYSMPRTDLYRSVAEALGDLGLRWVLARGFMDYGEHHGMPLCQLYPVDRALAEWDDLRAELAAPLFSFALAPELPFAVSRDGLLALRRYADRHGLLITMHVHENDLDDRASLADYGRRTVPLLDEMGFWGPDVLAVHCIKTQAEDIEIFARHDVKVSYNPVSNMYMGMGIAPIEAMRRAGLTVALGTDGAASHNCQDMIETLKIAALLQKLALEDPTATTAAEALDMATIEGARAIGQADRIGLWNRASRPTSSSWTRCRPGRPRCSTPSPAWSTRRAPAAWPPSSLPGGCCWMRGASPRWMSERSWSSARSAAWQLARRVGTDRRIRGDDIGLAHREMRPGRLCSFNSFRQHIPPHRPVRIQRLGLRGDLGQVQIHVLRLNAVSAMVRFTAACTAAFTSSGEAPSSPLSGCT